MTSKRLLLRAIDTGSMLGSMSSDARAQAFSSVQTSNSTDWLVGGGEMGRCIRALDWSRTALGPLASWPQSLRTAVGLALSCEFPITMAWGPSCIQIYNDAYRQFCGAKHPRSLGQDFRQCWESCWPEVGEPFARAFSGQGTYLENQRMFLDRHGYLEETFFTYSYSPIHDEAGKVSGMFCPVTETTPQILSERRTRFLRDLAVHASGAENGEAALQAMAMGLAEASFDLPFMLVYLVQQDTQRACLVSSTGFPNGVDCAKAWPLLEVVRTGQPQQIDEVDARLSELAVGPYPEPVTTALALPLRISGAEHPAGVIIMGVSARLRLNEAYRAFYDLLAAGISREFAAASAYAEERRRAEALAELDRAKTQFFSNVSHEFRTPLTLMLAPLEDELNERDAPLPPARRARLEAAQRNAVRLLKLVNTLLDFSRIEAGRMQAHYAPIDLATYTSELAGMFRSTIERAGIRFDVECPPLPADVYVDRDMWEKIVMNVLSNAFKHTFEGVISVRLAWQESRVELSVSDTGIGIGQAELARVFERFHRVRDAKSRSHEGTGIGLALVRELALQHGGEVALESELGRGTTCRVCLRTGASHLPAEHVSRTAEAASSKHAAAYVQEALQWLPSQLRAAADNQVGQSSARIILIDDNADMREYLARLLGAHYHVRAFSDGQSAVEHAHNAAPDLIVSDIMMPGLDGFGVLRALRIDPRTKTVPVILLSARAGEESAIAGLKGGADDYLIKPFSARELLARVQTHLELANTRRQWARELERANRELETFSYSVSHDLRAPLRQIEGFSRRVLTRHHERLDEEGRTDLGRVRAAATQMSNLIEDLLELARVSRHPLRRQPVNIGELARRVFDELVQRGAAPQIALQVQPDLRAQADPSLLRVVLQNLLSNAVKFSQRQNDPQVTIGKVQEPGLATFYVADNGAGFDMKHVGRLFAPFSRLHARHEFEGTGVGLATVQRIVERHGGRIWAHSKPGAGATFYFTLASE